MQSLAGHIIFLQAAHPYVPNAALWEKGCARCNDNNTYLFVNAALNALQA